MFLCSWFWWVAGVSPVFLGVVLVVRLVFGSRVRGCSLFLFLVVLLRGCAGVRGAGCGWFRAWGSMWCARSPSIIECWWGVGRAGPGCRECFAGSGRVRFFSALLGGGGLGVFFSARRSLFFGSGVGLRGLVGVGGFGGCRVGLGFFLRLLLFGPGRCRFLLGCGGWCWLWVVLVLFGEFDPGSGRTLAACLTHASRTGPLLWGRVEWRTGEYHVSNLPSSPG